MIRPSQCPVSGHDTFDLAIEALGEIVTRPLWLLRTALLPFVVVWGIKSLFYALDQAGVLADSVWVTSLRWTVEIAVFLPCALAWCRIGYMSAGASRAPRVLERNGMRQALDVLLIAMGAIAILAFGLDLLSAALTGSRAAGFPARGLVLFAAGLVVIPGIMFGGVRLLVGVAAAAIGWPIGFSGALVLTSERAGWLAGVGLTFLCLFPLATESVAGLRDLVGGPFVDLPGVWRGVAFMLVALLVAAAGHSLGHALRRLEDGMPKEEEKNGKATDQEIG